MKLKYILGISIIFLSIGAVEAKQNNQVLKVPFYNLSIPEGWGVQAHYTLNSHQTIVCDDIYNGHGYVDWSYKGARYTETLPITLKNTERYPGEMADTVGTINIESQETDGRLMVVTCEYKNMD